MMRRPHCILHRSAVVDVMIPEPCDAQVQQEYATMADYVCATILGYGTAFDAGEG